MRHRPRNEGEGWGRAVALIEDRIEAGDAYRAAFDLAVHLACERFLACSVSGDPIASVAAFRAAGGRTAMTKQAIHDACSTTDGADAEAGSKLWPHSARRLLLQNSGRVMDRASMAEYRTLRAREDAERADERESTAAAAGARDE